MTPGRPQVIVVGLGAMGAAVLYQLAARGVRALGVDRHTSPHALGSSHGETRITRCAVGEGETYAPLALASHRIWRELEALTGRTLLVQSGCLIMAPVGGSAVHHGKTDFVARTVASAQAFDIPHEMIDGAEIACRYPGLTGLDGMHGFLEPGGGFVHPERCVEAQLELARARGAETRLGTVSAVAQAGTGLAAVTIDGEVHEADQVVVAAGSWTARLLGAPFDRLLAVHRQVLHWFPVDDAAAAAYAPDRFPTVIWMHGEKAHNYFYAFPALPGTGLLKAATEQYEAHADPDAVDRGVAPREQAAMFDRHLAGRLAGVRPEGARSVTCLYTVTPDSGFIVDRHPAMDRVTVVSACSGHGFKHSAGIGELVARSLEGVGDRAGLAPFALARLAQEGPGGG